MVRDALGRGSRRVARSVEELFSAQGPAFRRLAESHAGSVAGDTLITVSLAGTLFFQVPSSEARDKMALYLLLTLAPFALIGPVLTRLFLRFPTSYRAGIILSTATRTVVAFAMLVAGVDTLWLFPLAFFLLVLSRVHGIGRGSLMPVVIEEPAELVSANARLARIGILSSAVVALPGAGLAAIAPWLGISVAALIFVAATVAGVQLPPVPPEMAEGGWRRRTRAPRNIRLARVATAGARFLNGYLLLLVAFEFRDVDAPVADFGALAAAAGLGFFLSSLVSPWLERRLREEPMVVAALAIEAAAAFIAAQVFGLPAAAALAAAAGLAWGTAKFGFDGLLQATVPPVDRGHAFTVSETLYQIAWVVGALLPVVISIPLQLGLAIAGIGALVAQLVYVSGLLVPLAEARRRATARPSEPEPASGEVTDYL
jgi:hypothetical protein